MHITSHSALNYLPPTVYATFRIGMAVPLLFLSAGVQVATCTSPSLWASTVLRHATARRFDVFQGVGGLSNQEPSFRTEWGDAPVFVILGLLGVAIPQTLVYVGNKVPTAVIHQLYAPLFRTT